TVPYINVGEIKNSGVDIDVSTFFNLTDELRLNTTLTFTSYDNEIVKITDELQYFDLEGRRFNGSTIIRNAERHAVSEFFGYEIEGFWDSTDEINQANAAAAAASANANATYQNDVADGRFRYRDVNGDGRVTDAERIFLGNPNPDFTYVLNLEFLNKN